MQRFVVSLAVLVSCASLNACGVPTWTPTLHPSDATVLSDDSGRRWLKVHTHSGELYVFNSWEAPESDHDVTGVGTRFDADREMVETRVFRIARDSIALLETNDRDAVNAFALTGLGVFSAMNAIATVVCLADPKSCFGSCPTFYTTEHADRPLAEGFSASFAKVLEDGDVDDLGLAAGAGPYSLVMRNEAPETHAVRHARLLAVPVLGEGEVFLTNGGDLVRAERVGPPRACRAAGGSCLEETAGHDDFEYAPPADASDLARREEIVLTFGPASGELGLVLSARQSFVTTYVFYQSLAYAGGGTGDLLASLERGEPGVRERVLGVANELGGIEVFVRASADEWRLAGVFDEAGPIATDRQVLPLGAFHVEELEVKLRMAQGGWRIDEVGLARLGDVVRPTALEPDSVTPLGSAGVDALDRLLDPDAYLVTTQGDAYRIWYTLPEGAPSRLFLDTKGYYYEWMRDGWLADEDPVRAASVLMRPREALRMMAPGFKEIEGDMERLFWASRFRR